MFSLGNWRHTHTRRCACAYKNIHFILSIHLFPSLPLLFSIHYHHAHANTHYTSEPHVHKRCTSWIFACDIWIRTLSLNTQHTGLLGEGALRWKNVRKFKSQTEYTQKHIVYLKTLFIMWPDQVWFAQGPMSVSMIFKHIHSFRIVVTMRHRWVRGLPSQQVI